LFPWIRSVIFVRGVWVVGGGRADVHAGGYCGHAAGLVGEVEDDEEGRRWAVDP
jgi:hypothetical protein